MKSKVKKVIGISLVITILLGICVFGISKNKKKLINIEYYFYNPCKSCSDGEEFKENLEMMINEKKIVNPEGYEISAKNIAEDDVNDEFKKITKNINITDGLEASVPLLIVNDIFIFGTEAIEKEGIKVIEKESKK